MDKGKITDLYMSNEYIDLTKRKNRRKFVNHRPVMTKEQFNASPFFTAIMGFIWIGICILVAYHMI